MSLNPNERSKVLLKAVYDSIRKLDAIYKNGKAIKTIFCYEAYGYRLRLKETLQKLLFLDPALHARRSEEILWRKVFYEPFHLYKLYVKNNDRPNKIMAFELALRMHLLSGIGYYQSLLLQIQSETFIDHSKTYPWLPVAFHIPIYDDKMFAFEVERLSSRGPDEKIIQKCLMYMGDLFRYLLELGETGAKALAYGCYTTALNFDPGVGLPHNQLGILDVGRCYGLNAIFHYLLCLDSSIPFEGAKRNLWNVLSKNEMRYRKLFGEKPIFCIYVRHPHRYGPKDFRKTITKFIYLTQQFLKPASEPKDATVPQLFRDTLSELHLMLSISSNLLLEAEQLSDENKEGSGGDEPQDCSFFSEQLTGPIFVRILLISLLTANSTAFGWKQQQQQQQKSECSGSRGPTPDATSGIVKEGGDGVTDKTNTENVESDADQAATSLSTVHDHAALSDPYGPLSFLLSLSELYMDHVLTQLRCLLVTHLRIVEQGEEELASSGVRSVGNHTELNPNDDKYASTAEVPSSSTTVSESDKESATDDREHVIEHCRSETNSEEDSATDEPVRLDDQSSDETSSDANEDGVGGNSDELESDGDLWSSDDSSLLNSQDEMGSPRSSDEDSDTFSDKRLRRVSGLGMRRPTHLSASTTESNPPVPVTASAERRKVRTDTKSVNDALDPITEEDSATDNRRDRDSNRLAKKTSVKSSKIHQSTTNQVLTKRDANFSKRGRDVAQFRSADNSDVVEEPQPHQTDLSTPPDPISRAKAISRLYLLSSVKLVLDWLEASKCEQLSWLLPDSTDQPSDAPQEQPNQLEQSTAGRFSIVPQWCFQLTQLLNQLNPVVDQLKNEIADSQEASSVARVRDITVSNTTTCFLSDLLSPFGLHAARSLVATTCAEECRILVSKSTSEEGPESSTTKTESSPGVPSKYPLPEDWLLRGLMTLKPLHCCLDFERAVIKPQFNLLDETLLRAQYCLSFGRYLNNRSKQLRLEFSYEPGNPIPFHCPVPPQASSFLLPVKNNMRWSYSNRRSRGRFHGRYHPPSASYRGYGNASRGWNNRSMNRRDHSYRQQFTRSSFNGTTSRHPSAMTENESVRVRAPKKRVGRYTNRPVSPDRVEGAELSKQCSNSSVPFDGPRELTEEMEEKLSSDEHPQEHNEDFDNRRAQVMRDMARLRLQNEVDQLTKQCGKHSPGSGVVDTARPMAHSFSSSNLECGRDGADLGARLLYDPSRNFFSPYLVLDAYCIAGHLTWVKQLIATESFVMIVPTAVVAHLDYLKKSMALARVAIRYLEQETHSGNRFLRLQKPEELPSVPCQLSSSGPSRPNNQSDTVIDDEAVVAVVPPAAKSPNPRVVRRWVSILDCATFFSQSINSEDDHNSTNVNEEATINDNLTSEDTEPKSEEPGPRPDFSGYCDLLELNRLFNEPGFDSQPKTASVTMLIGSREASGEDMIVPKEFISYAHKSGVRIELFRDFFRHWQKTSLSR